jgi:hypothetical protein
LRVAGGFATFYVRREPLACEIPMSLSTNSKRCACGVADRVGLYIRRCRMLWKVCTQSGQLSVICEAGRAKTVHRSVEDNVRAALPQPELSNEPQAPYFRPAAHYNFPNSTSRPPSSLPATYRHRFEQRYPSLRPPMSRRPNPAADRAEQNRQTLKSLVKLEPNKSCADCKRNKRMLRP